jgi:hypothetical protein
MFDSFLLDARFPEPFHVFRDVDFRAKRATAALICYSQPQGRRGQCHFRSMILIIDLD